MEVGTRRRKHRVLRLALLVTLGLSMTGGTAAYLRYFSTFRFWLPLPQGSGPAGPAVPRAAFDGVWSEQPVLLLGIGDSVTAGFGADPGLSYFERLADNPPDEFPDMRGICLRTVFPNLETRNIAVSGSDSIEHLEEQVGKLETFPETVRGLVVMTTGGNDMIHWYGRTPPREGAMYGASLKQARPWIANFEERLETMLERITRSFPGGCDIYLASIYDPSDEVGNPRAAGLPPWPDLLAVHAAYNEVIGRTAARHSKVHLVDIRSEFLGHGVHCTQWWRAHYRPQDPHYWYFDNLEDPNNRGYDAIRRLFLLEMARNLAPMKPDGPRRSHNQ